MFGVARRKAGIMNNRGELSISAFRRPGGGQLLLFSRYCINQYGCNLQLFFL
jgi:hypothetical protein